MVHARQIASAGWLIAIATIGCGGSDDTPRVSDSDDAAPIEEVVPSETSDVDVVPAVIEPSLELAPVTTTPDRPSKLDLCWGADQLVFEYMLMAGWRNIYDPDWTPVLTLIERSIPDVEDGAAFATECCAIREFLMCGAFATPPEGPYVAGVAPPAILDPIWQIYSAEIRNFEAPKPLDDTSRREIYRLLTELPMRIECAGFLPPDRAMLSPLSIDELADWIREAAPTSRDPIEGEAADALQGYLRGLDPAEVDAFYAPISPLVCSDWEIGVPPGEGRETVIWHHGSHLALIFSMRR